jgi:O-antigen ligase
MNNQSSRLSKVLQYLLIAAPFLILVPRTNTPADPLTPNSLPSQEFMNLLYGTAMISIVFIQTFREKLSSKITKWQGLTILSLILFCGWQGITLFWTPDTPEGTRVLGNWLCFLIFLAFGFFYSTEKTRHNLYISSTIVAFLLATYQFTIFDKDGQLRGFLYSFYLKMELLALLMPLQIAVLLSTKRLGLRILTAISLAISCVVQMQLTKRAPLAGILIAIVIIGSFVILKKLKITSPRILVIGLLIASGISVFQIYANYKDIKIKIESAFTMKDIETKTPSADPKNQVTQIAPSNLNDRFQRALVGWKMFTSHPLNGVGVGGHVALETDFRRDALQGKLGKTGIDASDPYRQYEAQSGQAHNEYTQIAGETGSIGILLFLAFWGSLAFLFWKSGIWSDSYLIGGFAGLISYAICSAFTSFSFRSAPGGILVACVIIIASGSLSSSVENSEITFSKPVWISGLAISLLVFSFLTWRSFSVMRCYQIEREAAFMYDMENPDKNRSYLAEHQRALSWDTKNVSANLGFGVMLYQMHQSELAIPRIEYAIKHGYNRPWTVSLLAYCYEQTREFDKALVYLDDCIASFPKSIYAKSVRAEMLRKKGAIEEYKKQKEELANNLEATVWDIALRNTNEKTDEQIKVLGVKKLYDIGEPTGISPQPYKLEQVIIQMRAFHYLK